MTISRVPRDEPKRWRNGCFSVVVRLVLLLIILGAVVYAALRYGEPGFTY